jgi:hypothetical protein
MGNFRHDLDLLESAVASRFSELRNANPVIEFLTQEDVENGEWDDYFDVRNDTTGETYEVTVIKVDEYGIEIYKIEDGKTSRIGLHDLASLEDKISLVELMEIKVKEL